MAEKRLGEMLAKITPQSSQKGRLRTLPENISYKESHIAQTIANHLEVIIEEGVSDNGHLRKKKRRTEKRAKLLIHGEGLGMSQVKKSRLNAF